MTDYSDSTQRGGGFDPDDATSVYKIVYQRESESGTWHKRRMIVEGTGADLGGAFTALFKDKRICILSVKLLAGYHVLDLDP